LREERRSGRGERGDFRREIRKKHLPVNAGEAKPRPAAGRQESRTIGGKNGGKSRGEGYFGSRTLLLKETEGCLFLPQEANLRFQNGDLAGGSRTRAFLADSGTSLRRAGGTERGTMGGSERKGTEGTCSATMTRQDLSKKNQKKGEGNW